MKTLRQFFCSHPETFWDRTKKGERVFRCARCGLVRDRLTSDVRPPAQPWDERFVISGFQAAMLRVRAHFTGHREGPKGEKTEKTVKARIHS